MTGRLVFIMKRWWITALVFTLALSLTSCAKKQLNVQDASYGEASCDGTLGNFDVYLIASQANGTYSGTYQIAIVPVTLDAPGDIVMVTLSNAAVTAYRTLIEQVVVNTDQEVDSTIISAADVQTYDVLAITPYQPGVPFPAQQNQKDTICYLPQLGQGLNSQTAQPLK